MCNSLKWRLPWGDAKFCAVMCVEPPLYAVCFEFGASMLCACLPGSSFLFWAAPAIPRWHVAVARREKVQVFTLEARTGKPKQDTKDAPSQRTKPEQGTKKAPSQGSPQPENRKPEQGTKKDPSQGRPQPENQARTGHEKSPQSGKRRQRAFSGCKKSPAPVRACSFLRCRFYA